MNKRVTMKLVFTMVITAIVLQLAPSCVPWDCNDYPTTEEEWEGYLLACVIGKADVANRCDGAGGTPAGSEEEGSCTFPATGGETVWNWDDGGDGVIDDPDPPWDNGDWDCQGPGCPPFPINSISAACVADGGNWSGTNPYFCSYTSDDFAFAQEDLDNDQKLGAADSYWCEDLDGSGNPNGQHKDCPVVP